MNQALLQQIFWDVDEAQLPQLNEEQIIARALSYGTVPVLQSVFAEYGKEKVRQVFLGMKMTNLDKRRQSYFTQLLA